MIHELSLSDHIFSIVLLGILLSVFVTIVAQLFFSSLLPKKNISALRRQRKPVAEMSHVETISEEKMKQIDARVKEFFTHERPYLKPDYSLDQLAEDIDVPEHILAYFLNVKYKMNFRFFINEYRVDHFSAKIRNGEWKHKTLEAIAIELGFNNTTTFITSCKRKTGMTPAEYIKKNGVTSSEI